MLTTVVKYPHSLLAHENISKVIDVLMYIHVIDVLMYIHVIDVLMYIHVNCSEMFIVIKHIIYILVIALIK